MGDPSDYNSEIGGVYADFGSLAQQGFLTAFTSREHSSQVKAADSKKRRSHFIDTQKRLPNGGLFCVSAWDDSIL